MQSGDVAHGDLDRLKLVQRRVRELARNNPICRHAIQNSLGAQLALAARLQAKSDAQGKRRKTLARAVLAQSSLIDPAIIDRGPCFVEDVEGLCPSTLAQELEPFGWGSNLPEPLKSRSIEVAIAAFDRDQIYQSPTTPDSQKEQMASEYQSAIDSEEFVAFRWKVWVADPSDWEILPHPYDVAPGTLELFSESDFQTVMFYWLGGLADTGAIRPIVQKPPYSDLSDFPAYVAFRGRFIADDNDLENGQPPLRVDKLPPDIAEQMLFHLELWLADQVAGSAPQRKVRADSAGGPESPTTQSISSPLDPTVLTMDYLLSITRGLMGADVFREIRKLAGIDHGLFGSAAAKFNYGPSLPALISTLESGSWRCGPEVAVIWKRYLPRIKADNRL